MAKASMAKASGANRRADNLSHRYATSLISGNLILALTQLYSCIAAGSLLSVYLPVPTQLNCRIAGGTCPCFRLRDPISMGIFALDLRLHLRAT